MLKLKKLDNLIKVTNINQYFLYFVSIIFLFLLPFNQLVSQDNEDGLSLDSPSDQNRTDLNLDENEKNSPYRFYGYLRSMIHGASTSIETTEENTILSSFSRLQLGGAFLNDTLEIRFDFNTDFIFSNSMDSLEFRFFWYLWPRNCIIPPFYNNLKKDFFLRSELHTGFIKITLHPWIISMGRQKISWGEGRFLNPLNLITDQNPYTYDSEDTLGSDLFNFHYYFNESDSLQLVLIPYMRENNRNISRLKPEDTNLLLRSKFTIKSLDATLVTGYHFHSYIFGTEANLTQWDASFRISYLIRKEGQHPDYFSEPPAKKKSDPLLTHQIVTGTSYAFFQGKLRTNLELFFNTRPYNDDDFLKESILYESLIQAGIQAPLSEDPTFFTTNGRILTKNPFLTELSIGFNITTLISFDVFTIYDVIGNSIFFGPQIKYSLTDEADWVTGANFFFLNNKNDSEFQDMENVIYTFLKWNF